MYPKWEASVFYYFRKTQLAEFQFLIWFGRMVHATFGRKMMEEEALTKLALVYWTISQRKLRKDSNQSWPSVMLQAHKNRSYTAYLYIIKMTGLVELNHLFFESGHSQNESDSIHSSIERASKHLTVISTNEWVGIIKAAETVNPLSVKRLTHRDFKCFKELSGKIFSCTCIERLYR